MSAEFNWWLLIVGLVAGGALTWVVLADSTRRDREIDDREREAEAAWIARTLADPTLSPERVGKVLAAHHRYLGFPPPDALVTPDELAPDDDAHPASFDVPPDSGVGQREPGRTEAPRPDPSRPDPSRPDPSRAANAPAGQPPTGGG